MANPGQLEGHQGAGCRTIECLSTIVSVEPPSPCRNERDKRLVEAPNKKGPKMDEPRGIAHVEHKQGVGLQAGRGRDQHRRILVKEHAL
jgi:hypothetical protein